MRDERSGALENAFRERYRPGIIPDEADNLTLAEAAERGFHVQDYAIAADQAAMILDAMVERRRLPPRVVGGFLAPWASYFPAEYETD